MKNYMLLLSLMFAVAGVSQAGADDKALPEQAANSAEMHQDAKDMKDSMKDDMHEGCMGDKSEAGMADMHKMHDMCMKHMKGMKDMAKKDAPAAPTGKKPVRKHHHHHSAEAAKK